LGGWLVEGREKGDGDVNSLIDIERVLNSQEVGALKAGA